MARVLAGFERRVEEDLGAGLSPAGRYENWSSVAKNASNPSVGVNLS